MTDLPKSAKAVIIGGGVAGCSVAYHLASLGWKDVVLLERKQLTSGTTWHAAGLIGQGRASPSGQRISKYSADLYESLEQETGISTGLKRNGSLFVVKSQEREQEVRRLTDAIKRNGLEAHMLSPSECLDKYPLLNIEDIRCGSFLPSDGQADPANVALAMAKGARQKGAKIIEGVKVTDIHTKEGHVTGVATDQGDIEAEFVVNCAGMWARDIGEMAAVTTPLHACEHFYIVTEPIPDLSRDLPVMRCQEECAYYKEDAGKILLGAFEPVAKPWGMDGIPDDFCFDQLPEDFDHFEPILADAIHRMPILETAGIHTFFNGPESFTPDDRWLMGEAPNLKNFYSMCGFNSIGIISSGGAGKALAEWMDAGEPPFDLWDVDIRRAMGFQSNKTYLQTRVSETLGLLYADHFPFRQPETARGIRKTAIHDRLADLGACFGETAGWERPNWYLPESEKAAGKTADYDYSWGPQNWFPYARDEHIAVRNGAGFFDLSTFGKIRVEGPDAEAVLQHVCANDVAVPNGKIVYTQWLNGRGGVEADVTITRLSETVYLVITPAATIVRDMNWLKRHMPKEARCVATDVTVSETVISVMGPKARDILNAVSPANLSNEAFPFGTAQTIEMGMGHVRAHRISYVGELGWELYASADQALHIFDTLWEKGAPMGLKPCGLHVLDSCRIEKAFRHFGHDMSDEEHVLEAGLGFAVKVDKTPSKFGDFVGREAVLNQRQQGLTKRMIQLKLDDPDKMLYHFEPVLRDGKPAGYVTSANYGHHLGGAVAMAYVACEPDEKPADLDASSYEIIVAGETCSASASMKPMYDPKSERVKA